MLLVQIDGRLTPMLVDTGAKYTCVSPNYALHLPKSDKFAKILRKKPQLIWMTVPVSLSINNKMVRIPILVSEQTMLNLLGSDALCKLGLQIWCTLDGVCVNKFRGKKKTSMSWFVGDVNVYWVVHMRISTEKQWGNGEISFRSKSQTQKKNLI